MHQRKDPDCNASTGRVQGLDKYTWRDQTVPVVPGEAFSVEQLFSKHWGHVRGVARYYLATKADADDVAQEVFIALGRSLGHLRPDSDFRALLSVAARNRAFSWNRRRTQQDHDSHIPEMTTSRADATLDVSAAIGLLSRAQADVITLCFYLGLSPQEAAAATGLPLGTVKSRLRRAIIRMRHHLRPPPREHPPTSPR